MLGAMAFQEDFQILVNATQSLKLTVPEHIEVQNALGRLRSAALGDPGDGYLPAKPAPASAPQEAAAPSGDPPNGAAPAKEHPSPRSPST